MLVKDFNFRIFIDCSDANCISKKVFIDGNEARIKLYQLIDNTNANIELETGFKDIHAVSIFVGDIVEIKTTKSIKRYEVAYMVMTWLKISTLRKAKDKIEECIRKHKKGDKHAL